jgi:hypothetical protein
MSYDSVRLDEQMRVLDYSIDDFVLRYNAITALPSFLRVNPARQTLFLFPGGIGSTLKRATRPWNPAGPASQVFDYEVAFGDVPALLGGAARDLRMRRLLDGSYRDKGNRIVIADGLPNVLGVTPYLGFLIWCFLKQLDWFVFAWDWRRRVDDVGTFFIDRFLPHFQERVQNECNNADPLADYSLIGHSAGGLAVNWILRNVAPHPGNLRKVITVAAPFYGYGGQLHRWFEGDTLFNGFPPFTPDYTPGIIKAISSFPGSYSWHFLPKGFYDANSVDFQSGPYPLPGYPSRDFTTNNPADPYDPQPPDERYPKKSQSGFDKFELAKAANLFVELTSLLSAAQAAKFVNIRGDTTANNTLNTTTWELVPPIEPSPIADTSITPGDGTQPAWTTRDIDLAKQAPGNVITVVGGDAEHSIILDSPQTLAQVAAVLGIP